MPVRVTDILGFASQEELAEQLHRLRHDGLVEELTLSRDDVQRRRLRAVTDRGSECLIALPRDRTLKDGAVLLLEPERAIVVRLAEERWLRLAPRDAAAALELGYFAGNLHWRVRFEEGLLLVALEGPEQDYRARLSIMLEDGRAKVVVKNE